MTAPAFVELLNATESLQTVAINDLHESPRNPRKHFDAARLAELSQSIRDHGIINPLIVLPTGEIIAGHRRYRAAQSACVSYVPVICRDLTAEQALEVMTVDNLQREDVHPLEEGLGYRELLKLGTYDVPAIAAKVGKSESYIYSRLKLTDLVPEIQQAYLANEITMGHARLIAPLSPEKQAEALGACFVTYGAYARYAGEKRLVSLTELKDWINDEGTRDLANAPFDKTSADLRPEAGPCTTCPRASTATGSLFEEADELCYDQACYDAKVRIHVAIRVGAGLVQISRHWDRKQIPKGVLTQDEYEFIKYANEKPEVLKGEGTFCCECNRDLEELQREGVALLPDSICDECFEQLKPCAAAEEAIIAHGDEHVIGREAIICRNKKCPVHGSAAEAGQNMAARSASGSRDLDEYQQKHKEAEAKRKLQVKIRRAALDKILDESWNNAIDDLHLRRWIAHHLIDRLTNMEKIREVAKARSIEIPAKCDYSQARDLLHDYYAEAPSFNQHSLIVELLLLDHVERYEWDAAQDLLADAIKACGVDLKKIEKGLAAAATKKAAAKKKGGKK